MKYYLKVRPIGSVHLMFLDVDNVLSVSKSGTGSRIEYKTPYRLEVIIAKERRRTILKRIRSPIMGVKYKNGIVTVRCYSSKHKKYLDKISTYTKKFIYQ
jgi:hypothetical protein